MGLITKTVSIMMTGRMISQYRNLGYDAKWREFCDIKVEDLSPGSNAPVDVLCDKCGKTIIHTSYNYYCEKIKKQGFYACYNCGLETRKVTMLKKYGVEDYSKTEECQRRKRETCMKKYGVPVSSQNKEVKEKAKQTNLKKYGTTSTIGAPEIRKKALNTIYERYGVDNISKLDSIKQKKAQTQINNYGYPYNLKNPKVLEKIRTISLDKYGTEYYMNSESWKMTMQEKYGGNVRFDPKVNKKIRETNIKRYGSPSPASSPEVQKKMKQTMYKNTTVTTSTQQRYICRLYKAELNYPIFAFASDMTILECKIDIEYDGGGHSLCVKTGKKSQEEFDQRELVRNNIIRRAGYKQIHIISRKDWLPSDEVLLNMLEKSKHYFSSTEHTWRNYDIDEGKYYDAEHKDGAPYDYGKLRKITKKDINEEESA